MKYERIFDFIAYVGVIALVAFLGAIYNKEANAAPAANTLLTPHVETVAIPKFFDESNADEWEKLGGAIEETNSNVIVFKVNGSGGNFDVAFQFIQDIKAAQRAGKIIKAEVTGDAASAHAFVLCAVDEVVMRPGAYIMFHGGVVIQEFMTIPIVVPPFDHETLLRESLILDECVEKGRLTKEQVNDIMHKHKRVEFFATKNMIVSQTVDERSFYQPTIIKLLEYVFIICGGIGVIGLIARVIRK